MKYLYRVEKANREKYQKGEVIAPTFGYKQFLSELCEDNPSLYKRTIEDTLAKIQGIDRRDYLFLFDELRDAFIFSSKMHKGNSVIYVVEAPQIIHRGDMNTLDSLKVAINSGVSEVYPDFFDSLCSHYWRHGKTFSPCYEFLVLQAKINKMICNENECSQFHDCYSDPSGDAFLSVERTKIYIKKMNELFSESGDFRSDSFRE